MNRRSTPAGRALEEAIANVGSVSVLAGLIGVTRQAVHAWAAVPAERVLDVETATGVPRWRLRPDLWEMEPGRAREPREQSESRVRGKNR